jgi:16S rRNA (adenine1518-N6/adenine1519-N6)-dimethyltransferase
MIRPKKHLGQHFLTDENIAARIVDSLSSKSGNVVEVGPGTGVLTKYLLEMKDLNLYFFEVDRESVEYLNRNYLQISDRIYNQDFLAADLSFIPAPFTVIGNFPYNISSQILFKVLEHHNDVPEVVGMFQKEVAERLASPPGSKKYGILSVLLKAFYDVEYLFTVHENVFYPPPKVKSAVIRIVRNETQHLDCDEKLFMKVVKTAFNQRRKTLRNALKGMTRSDAQIPEEYAGKRAEQLSVEDFVVLTNCLQ